MDSETWEVLTPRGCYSSLASTPATKEHASKKKKVDLKNKEIKNILN